MTLAEIVRTNPPSLGSHAHVHGICRSNSPGTIIEVWAQLGDGHSPPKHGAPALTKG